MDLIEFKAGKYIQQFQYQSFSPSRINHAWSWEDEEIDRLLNEAKNKLNELNLHFQSNPDIEKNINLFFVQEALASSKIEGTTIEIEDVLLNEEEVSLDKRSDWNDIHNLIEAMKISLEQLKRLPLSTRIFNIAHEIIMSTEQGEKKTPGEFRKSQNWVGGKSLKEAIYIPPAHEELADLMSDLEYFIHNEEINLPHLVKIAIAHYQFITIHPYLDGNGKIGRLLILLYLHEFSLINLPMLAISEQLEKRKTEYLVKMKVVRDRNAMNLWIKFFIEVIINAATESLK